MLNALKLLIKAGLDTDNVSSTALFDVDWKVLIRLAECQGVSAICLDGLKYLSVEGIPAADTIDKTQKMQWIGSVMRQEQIYRAQWVAAKNLATLYANNGLDTLVMKGFSLSRLYPVPLHRPCTDMDCFLQWTGCSENRHEASERGNVLAEEQGFLVDRSYYKNSKISAKGLTVENHQYLLPVKGSGKAKEIERLLCEWIYDGKNECIADSKLQATAPFFDSVYVLAHAQEHFLNEGIILRHVCDWAMVIKAYADKVDWNDWKKVCTDFGMLSFGYAMSRVARDVCGITIPFDCPDDSEADRRLLDDTLYRKAPKQNRTDLQTRLDLVKGMFANRWKYRLFSDTNALMFGARRIWGYLFDKDID